jgi:thiol:disulfide interchange protein
LPKLKLGADKLTTGAVPVPLKLTVCVLPVTPLLLSVIVRAPVSAPVAVGEKVTLIVQEPLAGTLPPQLLV